MSEFLRIAARVIVAVLALLSAILAFSAYRYSREMAIDTSHGVNESGYVRIGGIDQWVQIRGDDRANPVLLWLNGGPGFSTISSTRLFRSWEKQFTIVMWDQRGEGRTFQKSGPERTGPMTIVRMTEDGIELAEYLRGHLHKEKIALLGHSWGSILGVRMVKERPDLFAAYVGTGQVTDEAAMMVASYPLLRARARSLGNQAADSQLAAAGPPPYDPPERSLTWMIWSNDLDPGQLKQPTTAALPWAIVENRLAQRSERAGMEYSQRSMYRALLQVNLLALGNKFEVPVIFVQGSDDLVVVTALVKDYFDSISAPHKDFVLLRGDGHLALFRDREAFLAALVHVVRPLLVGSDSSAVN